MCERMFTPKARSHTASSSSRPRPTATPAFAQNRSTGPKASSARAIRARTVASSATSPAKPTARSPIAAAAASGSALARSATTTPFAPSSTKRQASALPIPPAPPVTIATLSVSSMAAAFHAASVRRMSLRLSVLDQSPIAEGATGADALANTLDLARLADALGYHRYWVAEHHGGPMLASAAPEVLIGPIAQATQRIRVGSGGVMLPHYSPYKVAEAFSILAALTPGRIDLALGRASGTDPLTTVALQRDRTKAMPDDFPQQLAELLAHLEDALPPEHPFVRLPKFLPGLPHAPEPWLLGSSPQSAIWAAETGLPYAFADFINPGGASIARDYQARFADGVRGPRPHTMVAAWAICAPTDDEAQHLAASSR